MREQWEANEGRQETADDNKHTNIRSQEVTLTGTKSHIDNISFSELSVTINVDIFRKNYELCYRKPKDLVLKLMLVVRKRFCILLDMSQSELMQCKNTFSVQTTSQQRDTRQPPHCDRLPFRQPTVVNK